MSTLAQQKAMAWIPRFPALLSMLGSGYIVTSILKERKKNQKLKTYHRIMLALSVVDILASFWFMLSTIPVPVGTPDVYGARGNTATCTAQGFFVQVGLMSPIYSLSLWIYYLLIVSYNWNEAQIKRFEIGVHVVAWILGLGTSSVGVIFELYNSPATVCWIYGYPSGCEDDPDVECERGKHAESFRLGFYTIPLFTWTLVGTLAMFKMYWTVRTIENEAKKWRLGPDAATSRMTREVADQAFWYYIGFIFTWIFPVAHGFFEIAARAPFWLQLVTMLTLPGQGIFNFLVFIRPRYLRYRRKHPDSSFFKLVGQFLRKLMPQRKKSADASSPESTEEEANNVIDEAIPDQTLQDRIYFDDKDEDPSLEMLRSMRIINLESLENRVPHPSQADTNNDFASSNRKYIVATSSIALKSHLEKAEGKSVNDQERTQSVEGDATDCSGGGERCHHVSGT